MIDAYLTDSITLKVYSNAGFGEPIYSNVSLKARFEYTAKLTTNAQGEKVVASGSVMIKDRTISFKDKVVFEGKIYAIIGMSKPKDFSVNKMIILLVA